MLYGEVLHIVRPVIYVAFLRRFGRRSWVPWLVSLVCDIVGQCATARGLAILEKIHGASCPEKGHYSASPFMCTSASTLSHMARLPISSVERRELSRRLWMLLWYLMRDPLYARAVSPQLERVHTFVGLVPILGFLSRRCLDIVEGVQQYYVYTSAS
jgi:peroxin-16